MCELRISVARFCRWQVLQVSMIVSLTSWFFGDTSFMMVWQLVHATSRDSWELPFQKRRAPFVWHVRQIWLRFVIGVLSFFAKVINPPTPLPPPAAECASPGPWQASHASPSVLLRG